MYTNEESKKVSQIEGKQTHYYSSSSLDSAGRKMLSDKSEPPGMVYKLGRGVGESLKLPLLG